MKGQPLGGGDLGAPLTKNLQVRAVAQELDKTPAQILLKWARQKGYNILPKSKNKTRMEQNLQLDFMLQPRHMTMLDALEQGARFTWKQANPNYIQ